MVPFLGREKLSSLTMPRIHQFDADLRKNGRSLSMRRKVLTNVKTMLTFAQGQGLVAQNVAFGVKIKNSDRETAKGPMREGVDFPAIAEIRTLMERATGRWRPLVVTAVFTGRRASELRGLPWRDVDLEAGLIHVRQRADQWSNIGKPKSKKSARDIPLAPIVINTLRAWKAECPAGELDLVFPNGNGNIESHQNILNRFFGPLQEKAGIVTGEGASKYGLHALRHAAASLFIAQLGWSPKRVQVVLGHSSIQMTFDLYGHLFEDRQADAEAMKKLQAAVVAA